MCIITNLSWHKALSRWSSSSHLECIKLVGSIASQLVETKGCLFTNTLGAELGTACNKVTRTDVTHDVAKRARVCSWSLWETTVHTFTKLSIFQKINYVFEHVFMVKIEMMIPILRFVLWIFVLYLSYFPLRALWDDCVVTS